jgi:hypothetical protein
MTALANLVNLSFDLHLCLLHVFCMTLGLALLEDKQKFNLGRCVSAHKMPISYINMLSIYIK